jgi:predicted MFS family arabinose efflux permease
MDPAKKNVAVLALCQVFSTSSASILVLTASLVGFEMLGEDKTLATAPISGMVIGTVLATFPASMLMKRIGRRAGFRVGALVGLAGAAIAALSIIWLNFWLFSFGVVLLGAFNGFAQYYRFAAADVAASAFKGRAISLVLAGGVAAAYLGPEIAKLSVDVVPSVRFLGPYLAVIGFMALTMLALGLVDIPKPAEGDAAGAPRPLGEILRQPAVAVAILSAAVGYSVMLLIMTATPIAMVTNNHSFSDAAFVIQWHALAMFAPSFVTGSIIARIGVVRVIIAGIVLIAACLAFALSGTGLASFWIALFLLGIGWNFMFVGGTKLLTETHRPSERAKVQGVNDLVVFGSVAIASLSSGVLLQSFGWKAVSYGALPFLIAAGLAVLLFALARRAAEARALKA